MFYLNTIEQLFLFVEQLDQLEVCLPYSRLLTGIQILLAFQNLRWNSNKTSLYMNSFLHEEWRQLAFKYILIKVALSVQGWKFLSGHMQILNTNIDCTLEAHLYFIVVIWIMGNPEDNNAMMKWSIWLILIVISSWRSRK